MQVFIPSGSPIITYRPCRSCDPANGWAANSENNNGADPGWLTRTSGAALALNFTGTGVEFNIEYSGAGGAAQWRPALKVNGTTPPGTAQVTAIGVANLPLGTHEVELTLARVDGASDASARVLGVVGTLGYEAGPGSSNHTIDDSHWASGQVNLSQGWNMMEKGHSNTLNESELQREQESAGQNYNASLSWTSQVGAQAAIHFEGSTVWVFGLSGGEAGQYEVLVDNQARGTFDAAGGPRVYNQTLFHTSGLSDGAHTLTLVNRGGRLSYDYIEASKGLVLASPATNLSTNVPDNEVSPPSPINVPTARISLPPVQSTTEKPAAPAGASKSKEDIKTIVGASVGGVVGLLVLTLVAFLIWSACRRRKAREARDTPPNAWENDKPKQRTQGKGWQFINLPDDRVGTDLGRGHGAYLDTPRRQDTHTSGSSFGSTRSVDAAPVPVAHTRRSLLPFKNNLWAKKDTTEPPLDDDPIPINDIGVKERMSMSSPDPMVAALGGAPSPLTQLQRSFSNTPVTQPQTRSPGLTVNTKPAGREELADDNMPKVGTYEWYNWFGLGPSSASEKERSRTPSGGGFANMFRRSGSTHKSSNAETGYGAGNGNMIHLDPRAATSAAEERSPRRRFFNNDRRDQVDSMWARYG